jgi:hypothetical protein
MVIVVGRIASAKRRRSDDNDADCDVERLDEVPEVVGVGRDDGGRSGERSSGGDQRDRGVGKVGRARASAQ